MLGTGLCYPNPPVTEREPTFLLCVLLVVCALPLPHDAVRMFAWSHATTLRSPPKPRSPILTPARIHSSSALRIRHLPPQIATGSTPSPSQPSRLSRRTPKSTAQDQASPPSHRPTSKTQDTAALRGMRRASPLPIASRSGLRLVLEGLQLDWVSLRTVVRLFVIPFSF
jgi:hypothetical protein